MLAEVKMIQPLPFVEYQSLVMLHRRVLSFLTNSFPKDVQRHLLITFSLVSLSLKNYTRWNMVAKTGKDYVKWLQGLTWQKRMEFFIL